MRRVAAAFALVFATSLVAGCQTFPRTSELQQDCMEREEFRDAYLTLMFSGHQKAAESLFDMQGDCMASQGIDVDDWL